MGPPSTRVRAVLDVRNMFAPVCVCGTVLGCSALHMPESGHSPSLTGPRSLVPSPHVEITGEGGGKDCQELVH